MSCELDLGVQDVVERIWKELRLMRLYTKRYVLSMFQFWSHWHV
jgi:ribosome-interacting GTPase 1